MINGSKALEDEDFLLPTMFDDSVTSNNNTISKGEGNRANKYPVSLGPKESMSHGVCAGW